MTDAANTHRPVHLSDKHYDRILATMDPNVRDKIAGRFIEALDAGLDIVARDGTSPAGERVVTVMTAEATAKNWSPQAIAMLRFGIRAVGRDIITAAFANA